MRRTVKNTFVDFELRLKKGMLTSNADMSAKKPNFISIDVSKAWKTHRILLWGLGLHAANACHAVLHCTLQVVVLSTVALPQNTPLSTRATP